MLRYFINEDIGADILALLRKLGKHKMAMIRRKSLFVLYNIYQLYPHLVGDFRELLLVAFGDPETPVLFAALNILKTLIDADPLAYKPQTSKLV